MSKKEKALHKTKIGGQALIEGIMMQGADRGAMAVRKKDGTIYVEEWELKKKKWYNKAPFIRGVFNFIAQLTGGMKYMQKSMEISGYLDDEQEPSKFEKWLMEKGGKGLTNICMGIGTVLGVALAVVLFMFVPTWIYTGIQALFPTTDISMFRSLFEGVLKIAIFISYMALTSLMKDIRRTYEYHGGEHKTIACYEAGEELTVENVRKHRRFHPRCGTSFVFLVLAISILVYSIVPINSEFFMLNFGVSSFIADLIRVGFKLLLLPVTVGISYEVIRLAGRYDNILTRIISAPGLAMQRITTKEPDDSQIECAIAAVTPVLPKEGEDDRW